MKILVSAGPTRERIDPVRFLSNRSSGKMGYAVAAEALRRRHEVYLVSGPVAILPPEGLAGFFPVESAAEMAEAIHRIAPECDCVVMAAAVADYRPRQVFDRKIKKQPGDMTLELERTEDILASLGAAKAAGQILVGFAAETDHLEQNALDKLRRKNLDFIAANDVSRSDRGFASADNAITLYGRDGSAVSSGLVSKTQAAAWLLDQITGTR